MVKKFLLPLVCLLLIAGIGVTGYNFWDDIFPSSSDNFEASDDETLFSLRANDTFDDFITKSSSSFSFESKVELSESEVKDMLTFEPAMEFKVEEKRAGLISFSEVAYAQAEETGDSIFEYEITLLEELPKGELVVANIEANRKYAWAFAVEADFQVVSTLPREKGTFVPIDSSIEIEFNDRIDEDIDSYISISPDLEYDIQVEDRKAIILHRGMKEATVYTVTIDNSLFVERESSFGGDFVFSFETSTERFNDRGITFWSDYESFFPGGDKFFNIGYTEMDTEEFQAKYTTNIYKYANVDDFMDEYRSSKNWDWYWTSIYKNNFDNDLNLEKATKLFEVQPELLEQNFRNVLYFPDELEKGTYAIELVNNENNDKSIVWFQVSPLAHYYTYTSESGLIWLYDFEKNEFISEADVSLIGGGQTEGIGKTNEKGLLTYDTPQYLKDRTDGEGDGLPSSFKVEKDGEVYLSMMEDSYWFGFYYPQADRYWNFLSTDRYVYRPSDTINFWGVVKGRDESLTNDRVRVSLSGGGFYYFDFYAGDSLAATDVVVSSFDTVKGSLEFEGIDPGFYTLQVEKDNEIISTSSLQIVDFETPAYQLIVTPSRDSMFAGETVDINVEAKFFDGTPVPNLEIFYNDYIGRDYSNFEEQSLVLDDRGEGVITTTAFKSGNEFSYGPNSRNVYLRTGNAEEGEISSQTEVLVFDEDIYMQLIRDIENSNEDRYELKSKLNSINLANATSDSRGFYRSEFIGDPVDGKGVNARIFGTYYEKIEDGTFYDPVSKTSVPRFRYEFRENFLTEKSGSTNGQGEYNFSFEPTEAQKELYTSYYVILESVDNRGNNFKTKSYIGNSSVRFFDDFVGQLSLDTPSGQPELAVGDDFKLNLDVNEEKIKVPEYLYYGYQTEIDDVEIASTTEIDKTFSRENIPGFAYQAVVLSETGFTDTNRVIASYDELQSELSIELTTDKDKYRPGEKVEIGIDVTDVNGSPVNAEVNIASVDEALFHVLPFEFEKDILSELYIDNIDSPQSGANRNESLESASLDMGAEQGGCFLPGTMVLMADGSSRPIEEIRIGDQVLSFAGENSMDKQIVTVQGVHSYVVDNYMVINDSLRVTGEHEIFLNGKWRYAGYSQVGDELIGMDGEVIRIDKIEYVEAPGTRVYNLNVNKTHTYFAEGIYVHNAEKGGSERSEFKDVSLFDTFETNAGGNATAFFDLPDNLTSWRISAKAFESDNILAGQNNIKIPVSLPVFANVSLNETYLLEDKPVFIVRAFGEELDRSAEVTYGFEIEGLGIQEEGVSVDGNFEFAVESLELGEYEAKFSVSQGDNTDVLVKRFEVVESYSQVQEIEAKLLAGEGRVNLEADAEGMVELEFVNAGKGRFLPEMRRGLLIVNNRLDQIATRNYLVDVLAEQFGNNDYEKTSLNLSDYYTQDDGLALFTYDSSGLELTALIADILDGDVLKARTANYLGDQIVNELATPERVSIALYGLASVGENVLVEAYELSSNKDNTVLGKLYLSLAMEKLGASEDARSFYVNEVANIIEEGQFVELNSLVRARLSLPVEIEDGAIQVYKNDGSVYGIAGAMAMAELLEDVELVDSKVSMKIGDQTEEFDMSDGFSRYRKVSKDQAQNLEVESIDGEVVLVATYRKLGEVQVGRSSLSIDKSYVANGVRTTEFNEGDLVKVVLNLNNTQYDPDQFVNYQIVDYLPSGLKPVINPVSRFSFESGCDFNWYGAKAVGNTITFSRSNFIFSDDYRCKNEEIVYYARVVSKGEYKAQAPTIEEYGNSDVTGKGEDINVTIR